MGAIASLFVFAPEASASVGVELYVVNASGSHDCTANHFWSIEDGSAKRFSADRSLIVRVTGACAAHRAVYVQIHTAGFSDARNTVYIDNHEVIRNISEGARRQIHYDQVNLIFDYFDTYPGTPDSFRIWMDPNVMTAQRLVWHEHGQDKCLDVYHGVLRAGNFLQLYDCNLTPAQAITVQTDRQRLRLSGSAAQELGYGLCIARPQHTATTESAVLAACNGRHENLAMHINTANSSIVTIASPFSCLVPYPGQGNRRLHFIDCKGPDGLPGHWSLRPF